MRKTFRIKCGNCGHIGFKEKSPIGIFYLICTNYKSKAIKCSKCKHYGGDVGPGPDFNFDNISGDTKW